MWYSPVNLRIKPVLPSLSPGRVSLSPVGSILRSDFEFYYYCTGLACFKKYLFTELVLVPPIPFTCLPIPLSQEEVMSQSRERLGKLQSQLLALKLGGS